jgi:hypothetical protein
MPPPPPVCRVEGTAVGSIYGLAVLEWLGGVTRPVAVVAALTLWVFVCSFCGTSPTQGQAAVIAAMTAPVVLVGPVIGSLGAIAR